MKTGQRATAPALDNRPPKLKAQKGREKARKAEERAALAQTAKKTAVKVGAKAKKAVTTFGLAVRRRPRRPTHQHRLMRAT